MSLKIWLAFAAAFFVISGTPGSNMLLAMTHGIHHGLTRTFTTMIGLVLGVALLLLISLGGLGTLLLTSSFAFEIVKYVGAAYLVYLGIQTWRSADSRLSTEGKPDASSAWERLRIGLFVALSNPKAILFGVAFFPQFIDRHQPIAPQAVILLLTVAIIELSWMTVYASGGAKLATWLRKGHRMRWFNRAAGSVFVTAGLLLGTFRR